MENYRTKLDAFRGCLDASVAEATRNLKDTDALIRCLEGERPDCRLDDLRRSRQLRTVRQDAAHRPAPRPHGPRRTRADRGRRNPAPAALRSEEGRVGKEWISNCRFRGSAA